MRSHSSFRFSSAHLSAAVVALALAAWVAAAVAVPPCALADTSAGKVAQSGKGGNFTRRYVDVARALNEVEEGKAAKQKLKSDLESRQKRITLMETELKEKKDSFDKQSAMMKPEARAQKQEELQGQMYELQKVVMQLEQELMDSQNQVTGDIGKKLRLVVEKIGDKEGYDEVVNIGDTVIYYKRHLEITDDVIRAYNRQYSAK